MDGHTPSVLLQQRRTTWWFCVIVWLLWDRLVTLRSFCGGVCLFVAILHLCHFTFHVVWVGSRSLCSHFGSVCGHFDFYLRNDTSYFRQGFSQRDAACCTSLGFGKRSLVPTKPTISHFITLVSRTPLASSIWSVWLSEPGTHEASVFTSCDCIFVSVSVRTLSCILR